MKELLSKLNRTKQRNLASYALVVVFFVLFAVLKSTGSLSASMGGMLVPICAYVVMALSLNLTVGILGELSLGHAGFMSVGAFTGTAVAMILSTTGMAPGLRLMISMIVGALFGAILGFLIGIPVLRLNGDYLAIVTLAFGEIIKSIFNNIYLGLDGKGLHFSMIRDTMGMEDDGLYVIQGAMGIRNIPKISTFFAGFVLIMISLFVIFNLTSSKTGRAIMAIRDNRIAAESVGIEVFRYKIIAFTISASIAGAAGALFASNYSSLIANKFDFNTSILILVFVVLGGQGNMLGSIIAAAALTILPEALREFSDYRMLVYAIILILVMLLSNNPQVQNLIFRIRHDLKKKKAAKAKEAK